MKPLDLTQAEVNAILMWAKAAGVYSTEPLKLPPADLTALQKLEASMVY